MIHAYFIGGTMDLTKRVMHEKSPPRYYFVALLEPLSLNVAAYGHLKESVTKRERYHLIGEVRMPRNPADVFVYALDDIQ